MDDQDLQIENLLENNVKKEKKKVNGKAKGNRVELNLCKLLTAHFGEEFSRALGSGARTSQVAYLPEHAKKTLTGDICVPDGFKWVIECKGGYESDMHLENILNGDDGLSRLDEFIEQVTKDADYCDRRPIILWKRNRKPWIAMIKSNEYDHSTWECSIKYRDWSILNFDQLLNHTDKEFWFDETTNSSN
jgi:hypothetical protein